MSATLQRPTTEVTATEDLAEELDQLEVQPAVDEEAEVLAPRGPLVELFGPRGLVFVLFGAALTIGALLFVVIFSMQGGGGSSGQGGSLASASSVTGNGVTQGLGGHGSFTPAMVAAAGHGTVYVQLGDWWVAPAVSTVRAGKVTFIAKNVGMATHELMIERAPIKLTAPGQPDEMATQGMIEYMTSGQSGRTTLRLGPGNYVLFCNVPGHYAAGQHISFTVAKS